MLSVGLKDREVLLIIPSLYNRVVVCYRDVRRLNQIITERRIE